MRGSRRPLNVNDGNEEKTFTVRVCLRKGSGETFRSGSALGRSGERREMKKKRGSWIKREIRFLKLVGAGERV